MLTVEGGVRGFITALHQLFMMIDYYYHHAILLCTHIITLRSLIIRIIYGIQVKAMFPIKILHSLAALASKAIMRLLVLITLSWQ